MRMVALALAMSLGSAGCVSDFVKPDGGADAGCTIPAQASIKCGQTTCNPQSLAAPACCVFPNSTTCGRIDTCAADAGAQFLWGCDTPADCAGRFCCVQNPQIGASGCPTMLAPAQSRTACMDLCGGADVRLCTRDVECAGLGGKTCKPVKIAAGGDKVVGACL